MDTLSKQLRKALIHGDLSSIARTCSTSSKQATTLLLSKGPNGNSSLHFCASRGYLDIFKLLVKLGGEPDKENDYGWSPLMLACFYGHMNICEFLLTLKSVNPDKINSLGLTALKCSIYQSHMNITQILLDHGVNAEHGGSIGHGLTALMIACKVKNHAAVSALLNRGVDCNYQCKTNGWTALFYAIHPDDYSLVRILLNARAEPGLEDWTNRTAMDLARSLGCDMDALFPKDLSDQASSSVTSSLAQITITEVPRRQLSESSSAKKPASKVTRQSFLKSNNAFNGMEAMSSNELMTSSPLKFQNAKLASSQESNTQNGTSPNTQRARYSLKTMPTDDDSSSTKGSISSQPSKLSDKEYTSTNRKSLWWNTIGKNQKGE